jgi:hypothetical protein
MKSYIVCDMTPCSLFKMTGFGRRYFLLARWLTFNGLQSIISKQKINVNCATSKALHAGWLMLFYLACSSTMKMEAVNSLESYTAFQQSARCYCPEDLALQLSDCQLVMPDSALCSCTARSAEDIDLVQAMHAGHVTFAAIVRSAGCYSNEPVASTAENHPSLGILHWLQWLEWGQSCWVTTTDRRHEAPTICRQSARRLLWGCQTYAPHALSHVAGRFRILSFVRGRVDPAAIIRLKVLHQNEKSSDFFANPTIDLLASRTVPQPTTLPRYVSLNMCGIE